MWKTVGNNITNYKTFPRIVGETGGKNYIIAHPSANLKAVSNGLLEGAFDYQEQKYSTASRAYIARSIWPSIRKSLLEKVNNARVGDVEDFNNFMGAVIDKKAFDTIKSYTEFAKNSTEVGRLVSRQM